MTSHEIQLQLIEKTDFKLSSSGAFYYRAVISEGVSVPYVAKIYAVTKEMVFADDLRQYLNKTCSVKLTQFRTGKKSFRTREFFGQITEIVNNGMKNRSELQIASSIDPDLCYSYEITVKPKLSALDSLNKTRLFINNTAVEVLSALLSVHQIEHNLQDLASHEDHLDEHLHSKKFIFEQTNETDLAFFNRLCRNFCINYVIDFEKSGNIYKEKIHFFIDTFKTPVGCFANLVKGQDTYAERAVLGGEIVGYAGNAGSLKKLVEAADTSPSVFFSSLFLHDFSEKISSSCQALANDENVYSRLFSNFQISEDDTENLFNTSFVYKKKHFNNTIEYLSKHYCCHSSSILLIPGIRLSLKDVSGRVFVRNSRVIRISTDFRSSVPHYDQNGDYASATNIKFAAVTNSDTMPGALNVFNRISPEDTVDTCLALSEISSKDPCSDKFQSYNTARVYRSFESGSASGSQIVEATVCDKDGVFNTDVFGGTCCIDGTNSEHPGYFYAKIPGAITPVVVKYVSTYSGRIGVSNFPRIGEKILLVNIGSKYYFLGYIPSFSGFDKREMPGVFRSRLNSTSIPDMSGNRLFNTAIDQDIGAKGIFFSKYDDLPAAVSDAILRGTFRQILGGLNQKYGTSEFFYHVSEGKSSGKFLYSGGCYSSNASDKRSVFELVDSLPSRIESARAALAAAEHSYLNLKLKGSNATDSEKAQIKNNYEECKVKLNCEYKVLAQLGETISSLLTDAMKDVLSEMGTNDKESVDSMIGVMTNYFCDVSSFVASGTNLITSSGDTVVSAPNIHQYATDDNGQLNLTASNIVLNGTQSITLVCGNSVISMNPSNIDIATNISKYKGHPFDSVINISPMTGVYINGPSITAQALTEMSLMDGFGGTFNMSMGNVMTSGASVTQSTMEFESMLVMVADIVNKCCSAAGSHKTKKDSREQRRILNDEISNFTLQFKCLLANIGSIMSLDKGVNGSMWVAAPRFASIAVDYAFQINAFSLSIMKMANKGKIHKWLDESAHGSDYTTNENAFTMAQFVSKLALNLPGYIASLGLALGSNSSSSISIAANNIEIKTNILNTADVARQEAESPVPKISLPDSSIGKAAVVGAFTALGLGCSLGIHFGAMKYANLKDKFEKENLAAGATAESSAKQKMQNLRNMGI